MRCWFMEREVFIPEYKIKGWLLMPGMPLIILFLVILLFSFELELKEEVIVAVVMFVAVFLYLFICYALSYKKIIFSERIKIKRRFFSDIKIDYKDITYIRLQRIDTKKGNIVLILMKNADGLFEIISNRIETGLIDFSDENRRTLQEEAADSQAMLISVLITAVIYLVIRLCPVQFWQGEGITILFLVFLLIIINWIVKKVLFIQNNGQ